MDQQQTQPIVIDLESDESSTEHNVDSCTTEDIQSLLAKYLEDTYNTELMHSQSLENYADDIGHADMTPEAPPSRDLYGEGAVGHMAQPQPSASTPTQGVMDVTLISTLQAPVQARRPPMITDEAKLEEDIRLAEALIPGREERGTSWSDSFRRTICGSIEKHYRLNPESNMDQMIRAIYGKLNIRDMVLAAFRSRIRRMIEKYLDHRNRMRVDDHDGKEKGKLLEKCPYYYHMHKALRYSKKLQL